MTNIILEGADATGKSTLANYLAQVFHMQIQESEGPPKSFDDLADRIDRYRPMTNTIFVRHPLISNPIYDKIRQHCGQKPTGTPAGFLPKISLIIYCQPNWSTLDHHQPNQHDTKEHLEQIGPNYDLLCTLYNTWAVHNAHLYYKIGNSLHLLTSVISAYLFDPVRDVRQFHEKFDIQYNGPPRFLPADLYDFRLNFLKEELHEYIHSQVSHPKSYPRDALIVNLENQIDALVDLVYVALGNSHLQGFDFREAWKRVHAANMTKVKAKSVEQSRRNFVHDVVKPPGFVPPSHKSLVENHAYSGVLSDEQT